jgi:hypothetical protein
MRKRMKWLALSCVLVVSAIVGTRTVILHASNDTIYQGVYMGDLDLGGMNKEEAQKIVLENERLKKLAEEEAKTRAINEEKTRKLIKKLKSLPPYEEENTILNSLLLDLYNEQNYINYLLVYGDELNELNSVKDFLNIDISKDFNKIPEGDLFLCFNMFPYIKDADLFIEQIKHKVVSNGLFVIRQYDGGTMRFGPMSNEQRNYMNDSLFNSVGDSQQFRHYDLDRVYTAIENSSYTNKVKYFETQFTK